MIKNICLHCHKYVFDDQNINQFKRMTALEYLDGVVCLNRKENVKPEERLLEFGIHIDWMINKASCELCGAPHAVISDPAKVLIDIRFFFSGKNSPSKKDTQFISCFRNELLS